MTAGDYAALFLMGLLGTGHCIGMCGVFALAASTGRYRAGAILRSQVLYQTGKALTYVFLAVVFALASSLLTDATWFTGAQHLFGALVGLFMIAMGVAYAFELRLAPALTRRWEGSKLCGFASGLLQAPTAWRSLLIGWLNGFLPCGLSLAAVGYAASFGSVTDAAAGAAVFGFSTLPGLAALALIGDRIFSGQRRRGLVRAAGASLILLGVLTLVRGVPSVHAWFHEHTVIPR